MSKRWIGLFVLALGVAGCGGKASSGETSGSGGSAAGGSGSGGAGMGGSDPGAMTCEYGGGTYEVGDAVPSGDCNSCTCQADGNIGCTTIACPEEAPCGGWSGDTCSEDEYCAYEPGQACGAADESSVCRPRPTSCDLAYIPVCGCDGETYGNACAANAAGQGVASEGECS